VYVVLTKIDRIEKDLESEAGTDRRKSSRLLSAAFALVPIRTMVAVFVRQGHSDALFAVGTNELFASAIMTRLAVVLGVGAAVLATVELHYFSCDDVVPASVLGTLSDIVAHVGRNVGKQRRRPGRKWERMPREGGNV